MSEERERGSIAAVVEQCQPKTVQQYTRGRHAQCRRPKAARRLTWGRRNFKSSDESRNVWLLSLISFGESGHNNRHAFPSSAFHGLRRFEAALDPGGWVITGLEKLGLAWKVVAFRASGRRASRSPPDVAFGWLDHSILLI